jgi:DNA-binding NarL/FixJ family response regulator
VLSAIEKKHGIENMSHDSKVIRILTVDDHPVVRNGIAGLVTDQADMVLVGEASNGREAIQQFRAHDEFPQARIIVLTTYSGDVQVVRSLKAGAQGYLLKDSLHKELLEAIRKVHAGKKILTPELSCEVASHSADDALTPAEISVLRLIADGNANKQIAGQLSISEETVKSRVKNILSKLGANDRTQAVTIALKRGIIELQSL